MTYREALDFIHGIERFGSKPGLRRVRMLLERMGNPQNKLQYIHVAGTNGKGSTCAMLSRILAEAGYETGLYISPFVLDFRERIQLNNKMISEDELVKSVELVKSHWDALDAIGETPTEFEVVVAVAIDFFVRQGCDMVVLEVGMGGRFDATNIIGCPLVSVIASISFDHMEYLGDTLGKIAFEKCGIIKEGGVTVAYSPQHPEAMAVIEEQAAQKNNRLFVCGEAEVLERGITGSKIRCDGREFWLPLAGEHQVRNAVTVLEAVKALALSGVEIPHNVVENGIAATRFPARLEILGQDPLLLLDGAHNLSGAQALADALSLLEPHRKVHAVTGMLEDKDVDGVMQAVLPKCTSVTTVTPPSPRAMTAEKLAGIGALHCADVTVCEDLTEAVERGISKCGMDDVLLMFGSLYLASELRRIVVEKTIGR